MTNHVSEQREVPQDAPHKITIEQLGDEGHERLMRLISDITSNNGRAVVYVYPELRTTK